MERETSVRSPETIDGNRRRYIWFRCFFYFHDIFPSFRIRSQRFTHPSLALTGFIENLVSLPLFPPSLSGFAVPLLLSQWYSPTLASASLLVKYRSHLPRFRFVVVFFHANGSLLSPFSFFSRILVVQAGEKYYAVRFSRFTAAPLAPPPHHRHHHLFLSHFFPFLFFRFRAPRLSFASRYFPDR